MAAEGRWLPSRAKGKVFDRCVDANSVPVNRANISRPRCGSKKMRGGCPPSCFSVELFSFECPGPCTWAASCSASPARPGWTARRRSATNKLFLLLASHRKPGIADWRDWHGRSIARRGDRSVTLGHTYVRLHGRWLFFRSQ
jgi:hypothetical protein